MKKLLPIAALLLLLTSVSMAQNRANIKGKVVDTLSKEPLEFATVAVLDLKDSSLVSYTVTKKPGTFEFHDLPSGKPLKLVVSFISYQNFRKVFQLEKGATVDIGTIDLKPKGVNLSEVKVTAEITPIIVKKDTIEFSAEAFKTPPNAVVEQLLKRLPGIQVDIDGTIWMNGKQISKLLIDGKRFFADDPKIASRNLDASLIDKVQVYDDRENDPDHLIPHARVNKIINLKLKAAIKKSTFGKWKAGYGTDNRFDGGVLYNIFRDTLQVSLIGVGNNLNRTGFSDQDLSSMGGFDRGGGGNLQNGAVATGGQADGGLQTAGTGGININTDYGKRLKINLAYFYSYTNNAYKQTQFTQQFLGADTLSSHYNTGRNSSSRISTFSSMVEWKPDTIHNITYSPSVSFTNSLGDNNILSNSYNGTVPLLNSTVNTGNTNGTSFQFQHSFSYYRNVKRDGPSLNITHGLNISPGRRMNYSDNDLTSYTSQLASSNLHRLDDNNNNNTNASLNISYRYPFNKKLTVSLSLDNSYSHNNGRTLTFNENIATGEYNSYVDSLSRDLIRTQFTEILRPELQYQVSDAIQLTVNPGLQWMQTNNRFHKDLADIDRRDFFLLPSIHLSFNNGFSLNYSESISQPSINDLYPYVTVYSQLYSTSGNPDLVSLRSHELTLNYINIIFEKQLTIDLGLSATVNQNDIFSEQTVNSQGVTFTKPVNKTGNYDASVGGGMDKGFKKTHDMTLRLRSRFEVNYNHSFFQVNNEEGYANTAGMRLHTQAFIDWDNKIDIEPSYTIQPYVTFYQGADYNNVKYLSQNLDVPVVVRWPKHFTFEATYAYSYNSQVSPGFQKNSHLLNLAIARAFQYKDRGEIRLSCYDIFGQSISSKHYTDGNSVHDLQSQIIRRYFLLSYSYRFNTTVTGKKE